MTIVAAARPATARPKTDRITMRNGDHLTCEVKELSQGKLQVKTDDMGTINIEWDKVVTIESDYHFSITSATGDVYVGTLELTDGTLHVSMLDARASIPQESVVDITPLARTFWSRLDGSLSLGYTFTRASNVAQFTFDWSTIYRGERNIADADFSTVYTDKKSEEDISRRIDTNIGYSRLLHRKRWFAATSAGYARNDELSLENRYILGAGVGVSAYQTSRRLLRIAVGFAYNTEESTDSSGTQDSLEGVLSTNFSLYRYDSPKTEVAIKLKYYPSLTEGRRYRLEFDGRARREVVSDFFVEIRYYTSADSKSPATGGWKSDYGTGLSLGYTY